LVAAVAFAAYVAPGVPAITVLLFAAVIAAVDRHGPAAASACMKLVLLYLPLLKETVTAFAGLASLSVVQDALVMQHHVLTDAQLNEAVLITRSTPGPVGLYVVPGAVAGGLAMITPALLVIPIGHPAGRWIDNPRVRSVLQAVVIASTDLLLAAAIPLARDALIDP